MSSQKTEEISQKTKENPKMKKVFMNNPKSLSQNKDKSLKFIENSHKIKTNLQYVQKN